MQEWKLLDLVGGIFSTFTSELFIELLSHITCSNQFVISYIFCLDYFRKKYTPSTVKNNDKS